MDRYLSRRVLHLLQNYLLFCSACGFIIFTYNEERETIRTAKWRRRINLIFGSFYMLVSLMFMVCAHYLLQFDQDSFAIVVSAVSAHLNILYMVLLQQYRATELLVLLNSFPSILKQVHSVTHRRIIFSKLFALRSVVRYIPMMITFLAAVTLQVTLAFASFVIVAKVIPDVLAEMLHHSVYIALNIVAQMYDNLNMALARSRMDKSEKFSKIYLELYRLTDELNKLLTGYFLLHFLMDLVMAVILAVVILLKRPWPVSMIYLAASTVNKMRCLMFVAAEISERSKFYQKVGVCSIEFHFVQVNFGLYCSHRIDKKMFAKTVGMLALYVVVADRYFQFVRK